jgi:hypothetical protein
MKIYAYIKTGTGEYPVFEGDLRFLCPDMEDVFVCPSGYAAVYEAALPEPPTTPHMLFELPPADLGGYFERRFTFKEIAQQPAQPPPTIFPLRPKSVRPKGASNIFPTEATGRIEVTRLGPNS